MLDSENIERLRKIRFLRKLELSLDEIASVIDSEIKARELIYYKTALTEKGYYHLISVGEHSLNLVKYGNAEDGHRLIALGGNGAGFPIEMQELASELQEENEVYYLARAGYDGSDDVKEDMTVDFVVEDYRKALQNAGIEAPYILIPHSYAGVLASYWVSKYPDEIEAMIDLDGVIPQSFTEEQMQEQPAGLETIQFLVNIGVGDIVIRSLSPENPDYSQDEQHMYDAMTLMTMGNHAFASEIKCVINNVSETWQMLQPNDVPKLYISAENGYESLVELEKADVLSEYRINDLTEGFEGTDEERRKKAYELEWEEMQKYKQEKNIALYRKVWELPNCEFGRQSLHS